MEYTSYDIPAVGIVGYSGAGFTIELGRAGDYSVLAPLTTQESLNTITDLDKGSIQVIHSGYYQVSYNISFAIEPAVTIKTTLYVNGAESNILTSDYHDRVTPEYISASGAIKLNPGDTVTIAVTTPDADSVDFVSYIVRLSIIKVN